MPHAYVNQNNVILPRYDYIFCGKGASASLLLLQLHRQELLHDLNILLIDPDKKSINDKTFCFWAEKEEPICNDLAHLISHNWNQIKLPGNRIQSLSPLTYNHVSSLDIYQEIKHLSAHYGWHTITNFVREMSADEEGPYVIIEGSKIRSTYIFDSRPPSFKPVKKGETHLFQSFEGWLIETEQEIADPSAFRFMDFNVAQQGATQFVYVLPFSSKTALVEITRFGEHILTEENAEPILTHYIQQQFGNYTIRDHERGCIPMSNAEIQCQWHPGIIAMGARNYQIKPSTGYAFKNMFYQSRALAEAIRKNDPLDSFNRKNTETARRRFTFYDSLLLAILKQKPTEGKKIFETLLQKVEVKTVLAFLDEKTAIKTELSIFKILPWKVFVAAALKKCFSSSLFKPALLSLITLVFYLLGAYSTWQHVAAYALLTTGLVTVGIPHGAVDHLLESGKWDKKIAPFFILKYLLLASLMGLVWYLQSTLALLFFLLYSSWHFGQADGKSWNLSPTGSFLWGAYVLFFLLGTHIRETNQILAEIGNHAWPVECSWWMLLPWLVIAFIRKNTAYALTIGWISLSTFLPLILAFGLYFIGQHSLTGWQDIKKHLHMGNRQLWLHSLPFHAAAWIFLFGFLFISFSEIPFDRQQSLGIFFIFLSCLSFPHVIYMNVVYHNAPNQSVP
jgi:lycopene beta-cyclase